MIKTFVITLDDDKDYSEALKDTIENMGVEYEVEPFTSGVEFMKRLETKEEIDIAIIDVHVPEIPEFNIIRAVEKIWLEYDRAYIIVVSGMLDVHIITTLCNDYDAKYVIKGSEKAEEKLEIILQKINKKVQKRKKYLEEAFEILNRKELNDR